MNRNYYVFKGDCSFLNPRYLHQNLNFCHNPSRTTFAAQEALSLSEKHCQITLRLYLKERGLRKVQPPSFTEYFLLFLSFNIAPYFQLEKTVFLILEILNKNDWYCLFFRWTWIFCYD